MNSPAPGVHRLPAAQPVTSYRMTGRALPDIKSS